jgi:molecular chaperone GrpE
MTERNGTPDTPEVLDPHLELEDHPNDADTPSEQAPAQGSPDGDYGKVQAERDALLDRLARLQAEFDNFRKRQQKEQADFRDYAVSDVLKSLLPVLDNFGLALKAESKPEDLRKGLELMRRQMEDTLAKHGVKPVPAKGEMFDPRVHEAIEMVETREHKDHQIIDELQRGYTIKDRLLRPAMVRVASNPKK